MNKDIDLGLELLRTVAKPGVPLTQYDLAAWCGCSQAYIYLIEKRALKKLRNRLIFMKDKRIIEAIDQIFHK